MSYWLLTLLGYFKITVASESKKHMCGKFDLPHLMNARKSSKKVMNIFLSIGRFEQESYFTQHVPIMNDTCDPKTRISTTIFKPHRVNHNTILNLFQNQVQDVLGLSKYVVTVGRCVSIYVFCGSSQRLEEHYPKK